MAAMALNLPGGSPVAARDTSQTPGHNAMRPQPTETASNGVNINGVDDKGATSPATVTATATPVPELVSQISRTPPQPTSAEPPSAQPTSTGTLPSTGAPLSTQPLPSTGPLPSTQPPPSTQLPSSMPLPSTRPVLAHPHINSTVPVGQPIHSEATHPPDQHRRGPPSTPVSSSGISPQLSQSSQHRKQIRDVNGVPKRFPSPEFDHSPHITGFNRDLSLLADAIQRSCPEAVRQAVRDKWQKCMMGSEFHNAFLMNAIIHHASGPIVRRAVRDFGRNMVLEAKHEIASHLKPQDLDEIASAILEKCSDNFLDRALEKRLSTIDARSLINALARAERLGYESSDVLEDRRGEIVSTVQANGSRATLDKSFTGIQPHPPPAIPAPASLPYQIQPVQSAQHAPPATDLKCPLCWRQFQQTKPYEYHINKQLCMKAKSDTKKYQHWCDECGAGFTTKVGQQYHTANAVCGLHVTAAATPKSQATTPRPDNSNAPSPVNSTHHSIPQMKRNRFVLYPASGQPQVQSPGQPPVQPPVQPYTSTVENPPSSQDDPYNHLTPQQKAELDQEVRQAIIGYEPRFKEAEKIDDPVKRRTKLESLHNCLTTKQSMIRKRYGVRLRVRRSRAEVDEEKTRLGLKHALSSPGLGVETPSAKRQRIDDGPKNTGRSSYFGHDPQVQTPTPPPANHLSVSEINNSGLGGSTATAATTDPTAPVTPSPLPPAEQQPAPNSLSSLHRKGYKVSSHVGQANQPAPASPPQRSGSVSTPVVLDESSDDTETDEEIPAILPPRKSV